MEALAEPGAVRCGIRAAAHVHRIGGAAVEAGVDGKVIESDCALLADATNWACAARYGLAVDTLARVTPLDVLIGRKIVSGGT